MKKLIVMNLKMNLDYEEAQKYVEIIKNKISDKHEIVFCPSFIYLPLFKNTDYKIGAQNVYYLDKGAYTGEVSPLQLKTLGVTYSIIGHSERRIYFKEDDELINKKIKACLNHNLNIILCIGESLEERQLKRTAIILKKQLINALKEIDSDDLKNIAIAYEPVWAIGANRTPRLEEIEDTAKYIKKAIENEFGCITRVLYGGSVNKDNIVNIMNINNIDGVLIGGASVDPAYLLSTLDLID